MSALGYHFTRALLLLLLLLLVRPGAQVPKVPPRRRKPLLMYTFAFGSLVAALWFLQGTFLSNPNVAAYVVHATTKIRPDDRPLDARAISIAAARNEFESFQVVVRAQTNDVRNVRVTAALPGIPEKNVWLYREALIDLPVASATGAPGPWPDPLIPDVDEIYGEKRNAFPFDVPAGKSQAVWVDLLVPADQAPGTYPGTVVVTSDGADPITLQFSLTVWDFELPSTASLTSAYDLGVDDVCLGHFGAPCDDQKTVAMNVMYATFALDHRITIASAIPPAATANGFDWATWDATYRPLYEGRAKTRLSGARATWIQCMWPRKAELLAEWTSHMRSLGWLDRAFYITCDEPLIGCTWDQYREWVDMVRQAAPELPIMTTGTVVAHMDLVGDADILCPILTDISPPSSDQNYSPTFQTWATGKSNRKLCWYFACWPCTNCISGAGPPGHWPNYIIDAPAMDNRIMAWLSFTYDFPMELYFAMAINYRSADPWRDLYAYASNGDGSLLYPGTPARIGGEHDIPIASIRLKLIREGREDYEYLKLLSDRGDPTLAHQLAESLASRGWEFTSDPNALYEARRRAAERIVELANGTGNRPENGSSSGGHPSVGCEIESF